MEIGRILKPQGINGEVKVEPLTDEPNRFFDFKTLTVGARVYKVKSVRVLGGYAYVKFDGVNDRNGAESLRNAFITIERAAAAPLDAGEFYIADLIGAALSVRRADGEEKIGKITRVENFGAADVVSVRLADGKDLSFAFTRALNAEYSENERTLAVDGGAFDEVAVYED